ncbi:MAG: hypothetical protein ACKVQK_00865 [Burkholderiales bacterium]
MANKPDNKRKGSRKLATGASTSVPAARRQNDEQLIAGKLLHPSYARFAMALFKIGDASKAYLSTHASCTSSRQALDRGRKLARSPEVVVELARLKAQALDGTEDSATKEALKTEVRTLAFSRVNLKKVPIKEKLSALRTLAELEGLLDKRQPQHGIRASFTFIVPGRAEALAARDANRARSIPGQRTDAIAPSGPVQEGVVVDGDEAGVDQFAIPRTPRLFDASNT